MFIVTAQLWIFALRYSLGGRAPHKVTYAHQVRPNVEQVHEVGVLASHVFEEIKYRNYPSDLQFNGYILVVRQIQSTENSNVKNLIGAGHGFERIKRIFVMKSEDKERMKALHQINCETVEFDFSLLEDARADHYQIIEYKWNFDRSHPSLYISHRKKLSAFLTRTPFQHNSLELPRTLGHLDAKFETQEIVQTVVFRYGQLRSFFPSWAYEKLLIALSRRQINTRFENPMSFDSDEFKNLDLPTFKFTLENHADHYYLTKENFFEVHPFTKRYHLIVLMSHAPSCWVIGATFSKTYDTTLLRPPNGITKYGFAPVNNPSGFNNFMMSNSSN